MNTKQVAKDRVERALKLVAEANELLDQACGELSIVVHASKQFVLLSRHSDLTRELETDVRWTIDFDKIDLDSETKAKLQEQK